MPILPIADTEKLRDVHLPSVCQIGSRQVVQIEVFEVSSQDPCGKIDVLNHDEPSDSTQLSDQAHAARVNENRFVEASGKKEYRVSARHLGKPVVKQP